MKPILKPTKFHYKGSDARVAETKRRLEKKYGVGFIESFNEAIERGKTLITK